MTELVQPVKRVEQYLYALCVLDFSNIPVPRSRLEIFTHAMITGELPEIAPETREEEYMVAIIKGDVSNLPTPKSRADHLLYRICLGETEIRDIELETRYEMLLAYLAEHGGTDLEHALINYTKAFETLYNTVEMPFKSAILKGQTLVNYFKPLDDVNTSGSICGFQDGKIAFQFGDEGSIWGSSYTSGNRSLTNSIKVSPNTKYFAKLILSKPIDGTVKFGNFKESEYSTSDVVKLENNKTNVYQTIITSGIDSDYVGVILTHSVEEIVYGELLVIPYQEGMENWDIPYFEGMQSVKMPVLMTTGKNFFNIKGELKNSSSTSHEVNGDSLKVVGRWYTYQVVSLKPSTQYTLSCEEIEGDYISLRVFNNVTSELVAQTSGHSNVLTFTTPATDDDFQVIFYGCENGTTYHNIQLEESSIATAYEPYKSNILTVNEPVELRGIGEVKDTLDCLTGEVIERTDEITLDVTNVQVVTDDTSDRFEITSKIIPKNNQYITKDNSGINNWGLTVINNYNYGMKNTISYHANSRRFFIRFESGLYTAESLKQKLIETPLTLVYQLETPTIKTVDLTIQDQDNQPTQLKTFNDVTYVETQADSVLPTVILEYGTKNEEALAALSQDHEEVADAQAALSDAIDSQSDEVETTMMALTEVYEGGNQE